jgi:hypothetical protein
VRITSYKRTPGLIAAAIVTIGIAAFGAHNIVGSHAATPYGSTEAVNGALSGSATVVNGSSTSGSKTVRFGSPNDYCEPTTAPSVSIDASLTNTFADQIGPGWVGGDASYSTKLPDGQEAFVFSDTLIGTAQANGAATLTGFIHNSELVGSTSNLSSDIGGTDSSPQTLITDGNGTDQWQVASTYVEGNNQMIFVNEFSPVTGSEFDHFTGSSGIAIMSLPSSGLPTVSSIAPLNTDSLTQWGTAFTQDSKYDYIYGETANTTSGAVSGMKLARVPLGQSQDTTSWQYWTGQQWASGESSAVVIQTTNVLTGVTAQASGSGYIAVSIPNSVYTDNTLDVSYACAPQGPWSVPTAVYTIPEVSEYKDEIAYIPTIHTDLSDGESLVVSYNVDSLDGLTPLEANIHGYQPRFLIVKQN